MKEKDIKRLLELSGTCRGATLKADRDFVLQYYGKEALEQVVQKLQEWGVPLDYEKIKELGFYPLGWRALSLLAIHLSGSQKSTQAMERVLHTGKLEGGKP